MCKTISIDEYKIKKLELKYFDYYKHIEELFPPKTDIEDIVIRAYFSIRYLQDLSVTLKKYMLTKEPKDHIRRIAKAEAGLLQTIAEVLNG